MHSSYQHLLVLCMRICNGPKNTFTQRCMRLTFTCHWGTPSLICAKLLVIWWWGIFSDPGTYVLVFGTVFNIPEVSCEWKILKNKSIFIISNIHYYYYAEMCPLNSIKDMVSATKVVKIRFNNKGLPCMTEILLYQHTSSAILFLRTHAFKDNFFLFFQW